MREDICTIPVSEVFEVNDGCPICRMYKTVEDRIIDYILGDAMMEPDVRIATNKAGFCERHLDNMMARRGRLQLALMLQTHIDEINNTVFKNSLLNNYSKKGEKAAKIEDSCFICDKIEFGVRGMLNTIYITYENEKDFRDMFNSQSCFCLPHFKRLITEMDKKILKKYGSEFASNLTRITQNYSNNLYDNISSYCSIYDYRANKNEADDNTKTAVERTVAFLNGRYI